MFSRFIVGLDIGTASIKVAVLERRGNKTVLRALFKEPSSGLRKGVLYDLAETVPAVSRAFEVAKKISKTALKNVYVNIGTPQIRAQNSRGIIAVARADNEIYADDIDRAIKASEAVSVLPNRLVIHNVTKEFVVDGVADILDPLGLTGTRLEVSSLVIDAFAPHVKNVIRAAEMAGARIGGLVYGPLAASRAALSKHQKNLGVVVIDMGASTTGVAVYEEHKLLGLGMIPLGADNITRDLAVGLKIPVLAAEALKLRHGYALAKDVNQKEEIDLKKFSSDAQGLISRRYIASIIEARLAEILELVNNELKLLGKARQLAGGVVLTGGGAKLPGLAELARSELKLASQVGCATEPKWIREGLLDAEQTLEDPEFVNAMGLLFWGADEEGWLPEAKAEGFGPWRFLRSFIP